MGRHGDDAVFGLATDIDTAILTAGSPPVATIDVPTSTLTWKVGDTIAFSGVATDPEDGTLPASQLTWTLLQHHCTGATSADCHTHVLQSWAGVANGSLTASDHEYPSYLELVLSATDSDGLSHTTSVRLDPQTVALTFQSKPSGLQLTVGSTSSVTPFTRQVIVSSANSVSAPTPQTLNGVQYVYTSWSDGGAASHTITAPATPATYAATYTGYTHATQQARTFPRAGTVLSLTGGANRQRVSLPFTFRFWGQSYTAAWVSTNGMLILSNKTTAPSGSTAHANGSIPTTAAPNSAVYAFWDDLVIDSSASVRTTVTGTAPNRRFIVEWRNTLIYGTSSRLSVAAELQENGNAWVTYKDIASTVSRERGSSATVGVEHSSGTAARQYSYNRTVLSSGLGIQFRPA